MSITHKDDAIKMALVNRGLFSKCGDFELKQLTRLAEKINSGEKLESWEEDFVREDISEAEYLQRLKEIKGEKVTLPEINLDLATPKCRNLWQHLVLIVFLGLAFVEWRQYGFYILLRFACCAGFARWCWISYRENREGWSWIWGLSAAVYNPFLPLSLGREVWGIVNAGAIVVVTVNAVKLLQARKLHSENFDEKLAPKRGKRRIPKNPVTESIKAFLLSLAFVVAAGVVANLFDLEDRDFWKILGLVGMLCPFIFAHDAWVRADAANKNFTKRSHSPRPSAD
jgi:hypothetical protein